MGRRGQGILASASLATVKITRTSRALRSSCFAKAELLHPLSAASPRASPKRFVQNNFLLSSVHLRVAQHGFSTAAAAARAAGELLLPVAPEFLAALREAAPTARFLAAPAGEIWRPERVLPTVDIAAAISCVRVSWGVLWPREGGRHFLPFMW